MKITDETRRVVRLEISKTDLFTSFAQAYKILEMA